MKNKLTKGIFILATILFASCSDEFKEQNATLNSQLDVASKINNLSKNYLDGKLYSSKSDTDWVKVAAADIHAASGSYLNGDHIVVTVIKGASASVSEYEKQSSNSQSNNNHPNIDDFIEKNKRNKYDSYGYWHYKSIENARKDKSRYLIDGEYDNLTFCSTTERFLKKYGGPILIGFDKFDFEDGNRSLERNQQLMSKYGLMGNLENQRKNEEINEETFQVLHAYYEVLESSNNITEFVSYSIEAEEIVTNSEMTEMNKGLILSVMATARYGLQYWNSVIN